MSRPLRAWETDTPPTVIVLEHLPPRIAQMIQEILRHQQILVAYDAGQLCLNFRAEQVKAQLEKLSLNATYHQRP